MNPFMVYSGKHVFHFTKFESALRIIATQSLKFGRFENMNDIAEVKRDVYGMITADTISKELSNYQSISLTLDKSPSHRGFYIDPLWGHYAQGGNGVCFVFDKDKLSQMIIEQFGEKAKIAPIKYLSNFSNAIYDELEIYSIDSPEYLTQIIQLIKILLYFFFNKNCIKNIQDSYTIYKCLGNKYKSILNKQNNGNNLSFLPYLSYCTTIFILMRLLNTPNFFFNIHSSIIEEINNIDKEYCIKFKEIQFENIMKKYSNKNIENSLKELYQDLKTYYNYYIEYENDNSLFQRIIDVIFTKIFGSSSILITFFNNQFKELGIEKIIDTINNSTYDSNGTDIITEGNEKFYEKYIKEDTISMKLNEEKNSMNENSIDGFSNEQLIKIPITNSLKIINDNTLIDVFLSGEDNITL